MRKSSFAFLLFLWLILPLASKAQQCDTLRYRQAIFQVQKSADVVYGNAPAMPAVYINENVTIAQDLKMDIYQPVGDTLARRPLMMFAFGGGFLIGAKEDEDARALCDSFARKGFVTASINYRLGMNISDANSGERAVFRAVQDWSAAIRFLKEKSDSLRIDTNWVFAGGVSAGSISAMHCQYMSEAERPASSFASGFPFPAPDLGCKDCSGNSFAHSSKVKALINAWGAIGDTSWIASNENVPMISFHGDLDPVVPYGYGFPFTALFTLPQVYGSSLIAPRLDHLGTYNEFIPFPGEGHNVWGTVVANNFVGGPTQHWDPILADIEDFLWHFLKPETGPISGVGYSYPNAIETYSVPAQPGSHWCWTVNGGTIVSSNPNSNSIDIQWQTLGLRTITARVFSHLDAAGDTSLLQVVVGPVGTFGANGCGLGCGMSAFQRGEDLRVNGLGLPAGAYVLTLCDVQGRALAQEAGKSVGELQTQISVNGLSSGLYLLKLEMKGLRMVEKVMIFAE
jgi:hypothetical protein